MGSNEIDINEIQDEVFDYRPLLSEEAEQNELKKVLPCFLVVTNRIVDRHITAVVKRHY
jgi:hypothetical protein